MVIKIISIAFLLIGISCKEQEIIPPVDEEPTKNPRNYSWRIDTLSYPGNAQTLMRSIWGSSEKDVYVVGHSDGGLGNMFHYNGEEWTPVNILGYTGRSISFTRIFGFNSNKIYAVGLKRSAFGGDSGSVVSFNGISWSESGQPSKSWFQSLWGPNAEDVWISTIGDSVIRYKEGFWNTQFLRKNVSIYGMIGNSGNQIYAMGNHRIAQDPSDTTYLFLWNGTVWNILDTMIFNSNMPYNPKFGSSGMMSIIDNVLYTSGDGGIFKFENGHWEKIFSHEFSYFSHVSGLGKNDIFAVTISGEVFHFNGINWEKMFDARNEYHFRTVWRTKKEVFIVGSVGSNTIVLQGK